jgi:hypothetical protein
MDVGLDLGSPLPRRHYRVPPASPHQDRSRLSSDGKPGDRALTHGDCVIAVRDLQTTQGLHISKGVQGIVAEDRGSTLVVFFDDEDSAVNLTETDLVIA